MFHGICPMCGGTEIYAKRGGIVGYTTGIFVRLAGLLSPVVVLNSYICMRCGYAILQVPAANMDQLRSDVVQYGWMRVEEPKHGG